MPRDPYEATAAPAPCRARYQDHGCGWCPGEGEL